MHSIFQILKKILGPNLTKQIRPLGHGFKTLLASILAGFPATQFYKVGITGTKGKTSTTILAGRMLNLIGLKTVYISTALVCLDGKTETLNKSKMSSIDGAKLQQYLAKAKENGCQYLIIEMSSQGLEQKRHWGLFGFDIGVFLNIFPEHIEAHGSWDNYKQAKGILFENLKKGGQFIGNGNPEMLLNTEFMHSRAPSNTAKTLIDTNVDFEIGNQENSLFKNLILNGVGLQTKCMADFEVENLYYAYTICRSIKKDFELTQEVLDRLDFGIPGRMEWAVLGGKIKKKI